MTNVLELFQKESVGLKREIFITTGLSGLANAAILAIINEAAHAAPSGRINIRLLALFLAALTAYVLCLRFSFKRMNEITMEVVHKIRVRLVEKIQRSQLTVLERIGKAPILNVITQDLAIIVDAGEAITIALQASVLVLFALLYIAWLSREALLIAIFFAAVALLIVQRKRSTAAALFKRANEEEISFLGYVGHMLDGFKETKTNARRRDELFGDLSLSSTELGELKTNLRNLQQTSTLFASASFYGLLATVVFILPVYIPTYAEIIMEITIAILFTIAPLALMVNFIPQLDRSNNAAMKVYGLEESLDRSSAPAGGAVSRPFARAFEKVVLERVEFSYKLGSEESFAVGPLSLEIHSGEILFIVGGNGSGKSTLLKLIAGLYTPSKGEIRVAGALVQESNVQSYRELYTSVFSDFHLFRRLYGLFGADEEQVHSFLKLMHLERKTSFLDTRFTNLDLSTGQKKRLALIVCLLDDRPIFLFDELAADQDPEFRQFLYEELLLKLKAQGKTVIAVTHDDRYFHVADRVIRMDYGKLETLEIAQDKYVR